jgi:hypothetical protein
MAIHVNGASMRAGRPPRVLVTGDIVTGDIVAGLFAARRSAYSGPLILGASESVPVNGLGYAPAYDLKPGLSTVWPEFSEAAK